MRAKLLNEEEGRRTFVVIFDTGDELLEELTRFVKSQGLAGSSFTGIGGFERATLGWFDWEAKNYRKIPIDEQVEVLSLIGNVALYDGEPKLHVHAVVSGSDGAAHGGHVLEGHVRPTIQLIVTEQPTHLQQQYDPEVHLALIKIAPDEDVAHGA